MKPHGDHIARAARRRRRVRCWRSSLARAMGGHALRALDAARRDPARRTELVAHARELWHRARRESSCQRCGRRQGAWYVTLATGNTIVLCTRCLSASHAERPPRQAAA